MVNNEHSIAIEDFKKDSRFANLLVEDYKVNTDSFNTIVSHLLKNLNYIDDNDIDNGKSCYGFAATTGFSIMQEQLKNLKLDMAIISRMSTDPESMVWYKKLLATKSIDPQFLQAQSNLGYALARLEQFHVIFNLSNYAEVLHEFFGPTSPAFSSQNSDIQKASEFYAPKSDLGKIAIIEQARCCRPYLKNEIKNYLQLLKNACTGLAYPVTIVLTTEGHAISCTYDMKNQQWILADNDNIEEPIKIIPFNFDGDENDDLYDMSDYIWDGLDSGKENIVFSSQIFTHENVNKAEFENSFQKWLDFQNNVYTFDEDETDHPEFYKWPQELQIRVMRLAARENHLFIIEKVTRYLPPQDLLVPFVYAVKNKNIEIVDLFLAHFAFYMPQISQSFSFIDANQDKMQFLDSLLQNPRFNDLCFSHLKNLPFLWNNLDPMMEKYFCSHVTVIALINENMKKYLSDVNTPEQLKDMLSKFPLGLQNVVTSNVDFIEKIKSIEMTAEEKQAGLTTFAYQIPGKTSVAPDTESKVDDTAEATKQSSLVNKH